MQNWPPAFGARFCNLAVAEPPGHRRLELMFCITATQDSDLELECFLIAAFEPGELARTSIAALDGALGSTWELCACE